MNKFQIVSPPFACGVAWLINVLIELNVKTTNWSFREDHWLLNENDQTYHVGPKAFNHLRWHLPALTDRNQFQFPENIEVRWEHRLDFARNCDYPTILFIRDPRDAIYSLYKRNYANNFSFTDYLNKPDKWPDHFPGLFDLPPPDTYALFCFFWLQLKNRVPFLVVRFEDTRNDPIKSVQRILNFLKITRTEEEITKAVALSSVDRAKACVEALTKQTGKEFNTVRKGKVGEWEEVYSSEQLTHFECGPILNFIQSFKYRKNPHKKSLSFFLRCKNVYQHILMQFNALLRDNSQIKKRANLWVKKIFGDECINSKEAKQCARFFKHYLTKYYYLPTIRFAVDASYKIPQLIHVIDNYNVIRYAGKYYALAQSLGPVDFSGNLEVLKEKFKDKVFIDFSLKKVTFSILELSKNN